MQQQINNMPNELDEEIKINVKKNFMILWSRKSLIFKVFCSILAFFILLAFVLPKKYTLETNLYINKTNNSNISEINPFVIDEVSGGGLLSSMGTDKAMNNELELLQSPLVLDNVIKENHLVYKKKFGIIPNKKEGELLSAVDFIGKGKNIKFENKKNTSVITITYTSKDPKQTYDVTRSIIKNYIKFHKEVNSYKSKSDKKIIESEYNRVKAQLDKKVNSAGGLPANAISGSGGITAMSAFSKSAQRALGNIKGQYLAGEKSRVEISEDTAKVANLSQKLEWAKLVEDMSDTSKVLVLNEPQKLRDFEYSSPKLLINILIGIVLGAIASLFAVILAEAKDKKLCLSNLDDEIIYDINKDFCDLKICILTNSDKPISFVMFDNLAPEFMKELQTFRNVKFVQADITTKFLAEIRDVKDVVLVGKIGVTDVYFYKQVKRMLKDTNRNILKEIIV